MGKDIFQVSDSFETVCRLLRNVDGLGEFEVFNSAAERRHGFFSFSLCKLAHKYVFCTGGLGTDLQPQVQAQRYSILDDKWVSLPDMVVARASHATCTADEHLYAFCGQVGRS